MEYDITSPNNLRVLQGRFPKVLKILGASEAIELDIQRDDIIRAAGKQKNHEHCVVAQCCQRQYGSDGVIVREPGSQGLPRVSPIALPHGG